MARNVSRGLGLTQPALGFNQPRWAVDTPLPAPLTAQPPLYVLSIAALSAIVPSHADAALLVAALCYGGILVVGCRLAADLYGLAAGWLALPLLLLHRPLYHVAGFAWSEALGILLVLLSLLLLGRAGREGRRTTLFWLGAGLCAGLAFATRYLLLAAVVGAAPLLPRIRRQTMPFVAYALGLVPPVAIVVGRNLALTGTLMGTEPNPSLLGLNANLEAALRTVLGSFFGDAPQALAAMALLTVAAVAVALLALRRELVGFVRGQGVWLLGGWCLACLA